MAGIRQKFSLLLVLACLALAAVFSVKAEYWRESGEMVYITPAAGALLALLGSLIAVGRRIPGVLIAAFLISSITAGELSPIGGMILSLALPPAYVVLSSVRGEKDGEGKLRGAGGGGGEGEGSSDMGILPPPWSGPPRVLFIGGDPSDAISLSAMAVDLLRTSFHRPLIIDTTGEVEKRFREEDVEIKIISIDEIDFTQPGTLGERYYAAAGRVIGCLLGWEPGAVAAALKSGSTGEIGRDPTVPAIMKDLLNKILGRGKLLLRSLLPGSGVVLVDISEATDPVEAEAAAALTLLRIITEGVRDFVPVASLPTILSSEARRRGCRAASDLFLSELGSWGVCLITGPDVDPVVLDSFEAILVTSRVGLASNRRISDALRVLSPEALDLLRRARGGEALLMWGRPMRSTLIPWKRSSVR